MWLYIQKKRSKAEGGSGHGTTGANDEMKKMMLAGKEGWRGNDHGESFVFSLFS